MRSEDSRATTEEQYASDTGGDEHAVGRLLKGAAGALLGLVGVGAVGGTASGARGNTKRLLVVGDGTGKHTYEIGMMGGGSISKAAHAGANDSIQSSYYASASGEVWHYNVDSYTYTGRVESVTCDGDLSVHFLDDAFGGTSGLDVWGESSGKHQYEIDTAGGNIDLDGNWTENADSDERSPSSEKGHTADTVTGQVRDKNYDGVDLGSNTRVRHIGVTDGHLEFSR